MQAARTQGCNDLSKLSPASYNVTVLSGWSLISSLPARKCAMKDISQLRAISISFVRGSLFPKVTSIHTDSKCADSLKPAKPLCRQNFFYQNYTTRCTPRLQGEPIRITIWEILGMSASVLSTATHVISKTCTWHLRTKAQRSITAERRLLRAFVAACKSMYTWLPKCHLGDKKKATSAQHMELQYGQPA